MSFLLSSVRILEITYYWGTISDTLTLCLAGVLEANFVEPAHDKQGFERTTVLARLEARLVQMQKTYWFGIFGFFISSCSLWTVLSCFFVLEY